MGWGEAVRLVQILRADPSTAVASAMEGWNFPVSREALALYDLFDVTVMAASDPKKPKPKPHSGRPWEQSTGDSDHYGNTAGLTNEEVIARLKAVAPV